MSHSGYQDAVVVLMGVMQICDQVQGKLAARAVCSVRRTKQDR